MKIPTLNKKLNSSLNQEALEKLYERLMRIINLPVEEYLENEQYVKEIETYNEGTISTSLERGTSKTEEVNKKEETESRIEETEAKSPKPADSGAMEEEKDDKIEVEQDDLICDEVIFSPSLNFFLNLCEQEVEELDLKGAAAKDKGGKAEEKEMAIEATKEKRTEEEEQADKEKKLSLYKIKKNRIIREFISVLRELDA